MQWHYIHLPTLIYRRPLRELTGKVLNSGELQKLRERVVVDTVMAMVVIVGVGTMDREFHDVMVRNINGSARRPHLPGQWQSEPMRPMLQGTMFVRVVTGMGTMQACTRDRTQCSLPGRATRSSRGTTSGPTRSW